MKENRVFPFEDELAVGILGRFGRLNGCGSIFDTTVAIREFSQKEKKVPFIWAFAEIVGVETLELKKRHSMLPSMYPVIVHHAKSGREKSWLGSVYKVGIVAPSGNMRWCRHCLDADLNRMGISYWKRLHHLRGVDWCLIHQCQLIEASPASAISSPGGEALGMTTDDVMEELSVPSVVKVAAIMRSWLAQASPVSLDAWTRLVRDRCQEMGIRLSEIGRRLTVSDLIKEQFPASWLWRYMPEVVNKYPSKCIRKIDGACFDKHVAYPALTCAAILAALFESADYALRQLRIVHDSLVSKSQPSAAEFAYNSFIEGLSLNSACSRFGADIVEVEALLRLAAKSIG